MSPWAQSALVYGFFLTSLFLLLRYSWTALRGTPVLQGTQAAQRPRAKQGLTLGLGALLAAPLALQYGGAGSLLWAVVGVCIGALLAWLRPRGLVARRRPILPLALRSRCHRVGRSAYLLTSLAFCSLSCAIYGQQGLSVVQDIVADRRVFDSLLQGLLFAPVAALLLLSPPSIQRWSLRVTSFALAAWLVLCCAVLISQSEQALGALSDIIGQALQAASFWREESEQGQAQLAAFLSMAFAGLSAALWSNNHCLADHSIAIQGDPRNPSRLRSIGLTFGAGLCLFLTGWTLLATQVPLQSRADDPKLRKGPRKLAEKENAPPDPHAQVVAPLAQDEPRGPALWLPMERAHQRSFAATSMGQSIVLPRDSPLQVGKEYRLLFRANPRGSKIGKVTPRGNGLFIPYPWRSLHRAGAIRFRSKDPKLANDGNWDLRIPVEVKILGSDAVPRGVVLVPKDLSFDLAALSNKLHGPYVELPDQEVVASVQRMHSADKKLGVHNALVGYQSHPENEFAPSLRALVSQLGFRGPYLAGKTDQHAPLALVAKQGFEGALHSQHDLVFKSPARGLDVGVLDKTGRFLVPPWKFLQDAEYLIFRHKDHVHRDLKVRVKSSFERGRLRFYSIDPALKDLSGLAKHEDYSGPYLLMPDYSFRAEVHKGQNLPDTHLATPHDRGMAEGPLHHRKSLVPLHPLAEPVGAPTKLYQPHPAELSAHRAEGPFFPANAATWLARAFASQSNGARGLGLSLLTVFFLVGISGLARTLDNTLSPLLGPAARWLAPLLVLGCLLGGSMLAWTQLSRALLAALCFCYFGRLLAWTSREEESTPPT